MKHLLDATWRKYNGTTTKRFSDLSYPGGRVTTFEKAERLIREFKGDSYVFGPGVLHEVGRVTAAVGNRATIICNTPSPSNQPVLKRVRDFLSSTNVEVLGIIEGAHPNAPRQDVSRLASELRELTPDVIVTIGGGSTIDATKAAQVIHALGGPIDDYFGVGEVSKAIATTGEKLTPLVAIQTAASSAAHLTKYANITDTSTGQKKLIVDEAIIPPRAVFDYSVTRSMPPDLTADGALNGLSHALEVLYGSVGKPYYQRMTEVAEECIGLIVDYVERAVTNPDDTEARTALGLATDLGGYAIMLGGTNGAHLTSFSLVDILSHGRACAIMNPYYTVFFAPAIQEPLRLVGRILRDAGLITVDVGSFRGRELGLAVAQGLLAISKRLDFPTTLGEVDGFTEQHLARALAAAKDPQLKMKLENMPVPLTTEMIDEYIGPVLAAAKDGDLSRIKNVT